MRSNYSGWCLVGVTADWLHHLEHIGGVKPSTLANYEYMLSKPNARPRKRGRRRGARVMREFGG